MVQSKKPKEEITLEDEEPRLVKLMIDYFYQLNYDDRPQVTAMETPPKMTVDPSESPESPVEKTVGYFESLSRTKDTSAEPDGPPAAEDAVNGADSIPEAEPSWSFKATRKGRKKWKTSLFGNEFPVPEPAPERSLSPVVEPKALLHFSPDEPDSEIDNTELSTNALMYALADKYGIEDLKKLAKRKFTVAASFERNWRSSSFPHAANLVCESTPEVDEGLRSVVIETLNQHRELVDYEEVQELLGLRGRLALALLQTVLCEDRDVKGW